MKVSIDDRLCTGHGMCYASAPAVFTDDDQGYGQVIAHEVVSDQLIASARHGARSCPERAIAVHDRPAGAARDSDISDHILGD